MASAISIREAGRIRSGPEGKINDWLDQIKMEGEAHRAKSLRDGDRYERIWMGGRKYSGDRRLPRFRASVAGPTIRRRNALLTENKPIFKIEPMIDGVQETANVLNETIEYAWEDHGFQTAIEDVVDMAAVFGSAGMSLPYNYSAYGGLGGCEPFVRDPRSVVIDPNITRGTDVTKHAKYLMIETVESIWDIQREFPGRGMEVKPETGVSGYIKSPLNTSGINADQQGQTSYRDRLAKLQEGPIPRVRKEMFFIRDPALTNTGKFRFPLGRLIVRANDIILSDGPAPFNDGEPDLVWFENRHDFGTVWGASEVEAVRYLQGAVNRIGEMFVNNTVLMGNSRVIADSDALAPDVINNLTNVEALIISKRRTSTVEWQPPTPMPPHFLEFISFALRLADYLVGLNDGQMEGRGRVEMRSGVQLEGLQSAAQVLVRAMARRLEQFIEQLGRKFISRIFQFYRTDRVLLGTGPGGQFTKYTFQRNQLLANLRAMAAQEAGDKADDEGEKFADTYRELLNNAASQFAFRIQPMSSLAATKVARAQLLMQMVEGVMLPRDYVVRDLGFSNADELVQKATEEHAAMAQQGIQPQPKKGGQKKK